MTIAVRIEHCDTQNKKVAVHYVEGDTVTKQAELGPDEGMVVHVYDKRNILITEVEDVPPDEVLDSNQEA
jgi:hypothetical protein